MEFTNLEKADVIGVLLEASTANVHAVFTDQTMGVGTDAALEKIKIYQLNLTRFT